MPEYDMDPGLEAQLERQLREYAEQGVRPFDAVEIAQAAAAGAGRPRAAAEPGGGRLLPAPVMGVLLTAALLVALTATAFAAGWLPLPAPIDEPSPTPTAATESAAPLTPIPATGEPTLEPTAGPTLEPTAQPTQPTQPAMPQPTPTASPTIEPSPTPLPQPAVVGAWRQLGDLPGGGQFVVVRSVAPRGDGFVAVGFAGDGAGNVDEGRVWTSADGQSWNVVTSNAFAGARLQLVVEHLGVLYAIGPILTDDPDYPDLGAYNVWRSTDGQSWEQQAQPAAFAERAIVDGLTSAGETLVAWGSRQVEQGGRTAVRPGIWTWTPTAGGDWTLADTLPATYDIVRMSYASQILVAIGNDRNELPWRSIWYSTDEGRTWQAADARFIDNPDVTIEDVAAVTDPAPVDHPGGVYAAVGWQGRADEVYPFSLSTTYERDWFTGGPLTGYIPYKWERIVAIPGGFLAVGSEYRFEINENCAPGPCEELIPTASRLWTASAAGTHWGEGYGGLVWDEAQAPSAALWYYHELAVGSNGIVMIASDPDFNRTIWFAPLQ